MGPAIFAVAKTAVEAEAVKGIGDAIAGLFGGGAENDARRAEVRAIAQRAATGDNAALRHLEFIAFEKRTGQPGDPRPAVRDGSASPVAARDAAKTALRQLVAQGRTLSKEEYYAKLSIPVPQNFVQRVVGVAAGQVADAARPVVQQEVTGAVRQALPLVILSVIGVGLAMFFAARAGRK